MVATWLVHWTRDLGVESLIPVEFLVKTLNSHSAFLYLGVKMGDTPNCPPDVLDETLQGSKNTTSFTII